MTVIASQGGTQRVSRFKKYDIFNDQWFESSRYATRPALERIGGVPIPPFLDIPVSDLDADGLTVKDYTPPI